jgi:CelD/BcsL family acetyltransferase involved in cellulose biosynthesis
VPVLDQTTDTGLRVQVLTAPGALDTLGRALDDLHDATAAPVTARRPWLQAWSDCWAWQPLVVAVTRGDRLDAVAALALDQRPRGTRVVPIGDGPSDEVRLPARDAQSAAALADGVVAALDALRRPWRLTVRHLPAYDVVAQALTERLPHSTVVAGDVSPQLVPGDVRSVRGHVSRNHHHQTRRLHNRLQREGISVEVAHLQTPDEVAGVLPEVRQVCRARDLELGRRSRMDDPAAGPFFDRVVVDLAARGQVRLTLFRLDGVLAAYVLVLLDGGAARMWHTRMEPRWHDYGAGRLAQDEAVQAALSAGCSLYDFMRGTEAYKWSLANSATRSWDLLACSGPLQWVGWSAARASSHALREVLDHDPRTAAAVERLRPTLNRVLGR